MNNEMNGTTAEVLDQVEEEVEVQVEEEATEVEASEEAETEESEATEAEEVTEEATETEAIPSVKDDVVEAFLAEHPEIYTRVKLANRVMEMESEAACLRMAWEMAKDQAKITKDRYESHLENLREAIRKARQDGERLPLFDKSESEDATEDTEATEEEGGTEPAAELLLWRSVSIHELTHHGIGKTVAIKLEENGIKTLGDLADWSAPPSNKRLVDLPAIGEAKATRIEEALDRFWECNPQYCGGGETDAEPEEEEEEEEKEKEKATDRYATELGPCKHGIAGGWCRYCAKEADDEDVTEDDDDLADI